MTAPTTALVNGTRTAPTPTRFVPMSAPPMAFATGPMAASGIT